MKMKLKLMMLSILALSLFGCEKLEIAGGADGGFGKPTLERVSLMGDDISIGHPNDTMTKDITMRYNKNEIEALDDDIESKKLTIRPNIHLKFAANEEKIKFDGIVNKGNMYFDAEREESREYTVKVSHQDFKNYKKIEVRDGNTGSTLKIDGNYHGGYGSRLNLGLYSSEDKNKFTTDKLHITREVQGTTEVYLVYNRDKIEKLDKYAKYDGNNAIITVDGKAANKGKHFQMKEIQIGKHLFELNYDGKGGIHQWKLEKKE